MTRPWWKSYPRKYWTSADWAEARRLGVAPPEPPDLDLDPTKRLLAEQARAGPRLSWGPPPSAADRRRREVNLALEKLKVRPPSRWSKTRASCGVAARKLGAWQSGPPPAGAAPRVIRRTRQRAAPGRLAQRE